METPSPGHTRALRSCQRRSLLRSSVIWPVTVWLLAGCGAPGEPTPPSPPIPVAVTDLSGHQAGDAVQLMFTVPGKTTLGERLKDTPTIEILRGGLKPDGSVDAKSFRVVDTIPGSLVSGYQQKNKMIFDDPVPPSEIRADNGKSVVYRVRAKVADRKSSADSNDVVLNLYPVPEAISSLDAQVTENGVQLRWTAPTQTSGGESLAKVQEYRVFRGELESGGEETTGKEARQLKWKMALLQIAKTQIPEYLDNSIEYGKTYGYMVRSVVASAGSLLESGDSGVKVVTPKDTFPPTAPQGVVAAVLPGSVPGTVAVDLSWSINVEADLAGYRVYRSDEEGGRGQLLTQELLPTPAFRDNSVATGKRYWYSVTAVDRAGNESAPSPSVQVETQQPSQ